MNIRILVAAHKPYRMPEDGMYLPLQVNCSANGHLEGNYVYDDTGDQISAKNPTYCELTALYWGWKNLDCDYLGLVHYRRYLTGKSRNRDPWKRILSGTEARTLLRELAREDVFVILPKKRYYIIETLYSHYAHSHHEEDLKAVIQVIHESYPEYTDAFVDVMKRRSAHMFNMCIMRRDLLDQYCTWLFDVLEQTEGILDISRYTDFDKRVFGRISELLLDVWITHHQIRYRELPMENMEGEHWSRKIPLFLKRKFIGSGNTEK